MRVVNNPRLLDPRLARTVPRYGVVVLVQGFFLLDTNGLRADGLRRLREMFPQAFVALAIYLVANRLPYLHQGTSEVERVYNVAKDHSNQRRWEKAEGEMDAYREINPMISVAKYSGLNRIAIASFQPKTTNTP